MKHTKKKHGGSRPGAGRKKKLRVPGDEPKNTTVQVEPSVIVKCRARYGSIANALRYAADVPIKIAKNKTINHE